MNLSERIRCLKRGMMNRCPRCGEGAILNSIFVRHDHCPHCKMDFKREDGFYSGAMAINYALVSALFLLPLALFWLAGWTSGATAVSLSILGVACLPILTYRYSQCLWLALYFFLISEDLERMEED